MRTVAFGLVGVCLLLSALVAARRAEGGVDGQAELRRLAGDPAVLAPPKTQPADEFHADGVTAIFYESVPWKGKPTRVFAWYGLPAIKAGEKVPAMVLVHGGGDTAFADWVKLWNDRGYAAIAMDTSGHLPRKKQRHWETDPEGGPPGWGGFEQIDDPPQDQWTYHAVADVMLAHSFIRSLPEVDADRVGLTGISWGGYLTCIVASLDHRFKFAAPVYGCGFLGEDSAWVDKIKSLGPEDAARWLKWWDPSEYLKDATMPMLWVDGTNDIFYPPDSLQKSYRLPTGIRTEVMRVRMRHAQGPGSSPEEIHVMADSVLKGGVPLARVTAQGCDEKQIWATFRSQAKVLKAELNFTADDGPWEKRKWETIPADLDAAGGKTTAALPAGAKVAYLNLIDARDCVVSTEHVEIGAGVSGKN